MAGKKEDPPAGAPAWVMTFADLMSLLMCFFVLLLSFSELDRKKYKQVAGSMSQAFGVQREIPTQESPKGVTIIAQEFAPGKPQPTLERTLRQETTDDTQDYLEVLEAIDRVQEKTFGEERGLLRGNADNDNKQGGAGGGSAKGNGSGTGEGTGGGGVHANDPSKTDAAATSSGELARLMTDDMKQDVGDEALNPENGEKTSLEIAQEALEMERARRQAMIDAKKQAEALRQALKDELDNDLLTIEAHDQGVLIKVREQGSFPSGQALMDKGFTPVLGKIAGAVLSETSQLVVAGHTDNIPIATGRFPSNWELSAARASSVVQGFIRQGVIGPERMEVRAFGETRPVAPNDSNSNRAQNRRVEIFINTLPLSDPELGRAAATIANAADMGI